jgi:multidrug transporter EmrE-like cation transporter
VISPPATNAVLFTVYVAASSVGLLMLKQSLHRIGAAGGTMLALSPDTLMLAAGFGLYMLSFVVWMRILARMPLSTAYPIAIGLTLACSTTGAAVLLGERFGALKIAGIVLIFVGCVALTLERK